MSICSASIRTVRRTVARAELPIADLPAFLCPGLLQIRPPQARKYTTKQARHFQQVTLSQRRCLTTTSSSESAVTLPAPPPARALEKLPRQCPGCGAPSQFVDKEEAGFYTLTRKTIKDFLGTSSSRDTSAEDAIVQAALRNAGSVIEGLAFEKPAKSGMTPFKSNLCQTDIAK